VCWIGISNKAIELGIKKNKKNCEPVKVSDFLREPTTKPEGGVHVTSDVACMLRAARLGPIEGDRLTNDRSVRSDLYPPLCF
jgi:hypothetical protein